MTQQDVADKLDITRPAVTRWESGQAMPRLKKMGELAALLGTTSYYLMNGEEPPKDVPDGLWPDGRVEFMGRSGTVPVRRLGKTHAGTPVEAIARDEVAEVPETVARNHPSGFLLQVEGDCMDRAYPDGCMVLVDPEMDPWPGCAVVAQVEPGQTVLRRYARGANSLLLSADSHSPHDDMIWQGDDVAEVILVGVVVWYQAPFEEMGF